MEPSEAICAKYLETLFRQPEGGTLIGRWDQGVWSELSKASLTSSSLELALLEHSRSVYGWRWSYYISCHSTENGVHTRPTSYTRGSYPLHEIIVPGLGW